MGFNLATVLAPCGIVIEQIEANNLHLDSRQIGTGDVFAAVIGFAVDGRRFIDAAIERGAIAVLAETEDASQHGYVETHRVAEKSIPVIQVFQLKQLISSFASMAYQHPSQRMKMIGVTGTNGKTSVTQIIASLLAELDQSCAVMGTAGQGVWPQLCEVANTTPDAIGIQRHLAEFSQAGAGWGAMEVSSHGLDQYRVAGMKYAVGIFTNLSRDHLDYHHTMENYAEAKFKLFSETNCPIAVVNMDDDVGREFRQRLLDTETRVIGFSTEDSFHASGEYISAKQIKTSASGLSFQLTSSWGNAAVQTGLLGRFNVANILAALGALLSQGIEFEPLIAQLHKLKPVVGRMETFRGEGFATAVVDYAHTPDALAHALHALKPHCDGEMYCIFGCGGDRDKGKRPMMGEIAEQIADHVVVTDDNPRSEESQAIAEDILAGCQQPQKVDVILDRRQAILATLQKAQANDLVLIAGKGHEDYQIIKNKTVPYDERHYVTQVLEGNVQ